IFLIILIFSTYGIANHFYGKLTGVLSALLVSTYSVVLGHSREYLLETSLISMVTLSIYLLIKSDDFKIRSYSLFFGIASGIGMQTRWSFVFFLFPVVIYKIYRIVASRQPPAASQRIKNILLASIISAVIFSPWYTANLGKIILQSSYSLKKAAIMEGDPHGLNTENFLFYIKSLNEQITSPCWLFFAAGFILYLYRNRFYLPFIPSFGRRGVGRSEIKDFTLLWWFVGSYAIITAIANKDTLRFSMPYLPAVAIFSTFWIKDIKSRLLKIGVIASLTILIFFQFFSSTYGLKIFPMERISLQPFNIILLNTNPPVREDWKIEEIEKAILSENKFYNTKNMVRIIPDHPRFTRATFEYYQYMNGYKNMGFGRYHNFPNFTDYIVIKTGDQGPAFSKEAYILTKHIEDAPPQFSNIFRKFREFKLPDGAASLYKRDIVPLTGVNAQDVTYMIKERLERMLLQFVKEHEGLEIQIIPYSDEESLRGRFKEITVFARKAMMGDYKHKDIGLMAEDIKFTFHDITVNLYSLKEDKIEVISLKEVIPSGRIYAGALKEYLAKEAKGIGEIDIHLKQNVASVSAYSNSYIGLEMKFRPIVTPENNIAIKVEGLKLSFLPIPSFLLNILLNNIYIFNQNITPCRVVLNNIAIEDEYLKIN
ncbi:MAG: glycosyltransferase family 39 protein, partial [Nitrospinae bacterium]|nr:glycosyltransferase family 39 protein [Nitrospinota bacterium]